MSDWLTNTSISRDHGDNLVILRQRSASKTGGDMQILSDPDMHPYCHEAIVSGAPGGPRTLELFFSHASDEELNTIRTLLEGVPATMRSIEHNTGFMVAMLGSHIPRGLKCLFEARAQGRIERPVMNPALHAAVAAELLPPTN